MATLSGASQKLAFDLCAHLRICGFSFIVHIFPWKERGRASGYGFPGRAGKPVKFFNLKSKIPNLKSIVSHSLFISSLGKSEAEPLDMGSQAEPGNQLNSSI